MPADGGVPPPPAVPRGWRINDVLPLHSPALSGGGVSENFFKDVMAEMEGGGGRVEQGQQGGGSAVGKRKKEKGGKEKGKR
jgi:signal recognition particle subunit SRP19